ncbi:exodeoxyribonuclease VII large subunit [soil metagenome]
MSRLPFDPQKMDAARAEAAAARKATGAAHGGAGALPHEELLASVVAKKNEAAAPITVGQLATLIDGALREQLPGSVRVIGEISNFTDRTHWYFSLKEAQVGGAVLQCVMFAQKSRAAGFVPAEGQQVVVTGRVEFYKPQGKVSFYVERIEPVGAGSLEAAYRALCADLKALGYFAPERKRPLPLMARRIAVITSRTGAALQDVLSTMQRRSCCVGLALLDVMVQGPQAAAGVARAIAWASAHAERLEIDAILVTRGGGSIEDLWAFNERVVAEAIFASSVPVVAAIGHETDTTIAELVADERCATPTQAAMRLTPDRKELSEQLELQSARLQSALRRRARGEREALESDRRHLLPVLRSRIDGEARRLGTLSARLERCPPVAVLGVRRAALEALRVRLSAAEHHARRRAAEALEGARRQLDLVGPMAVLARGYSMTTDELGRVVRRVSDVRAGAMITTRVSDGSIASTVSGGEARSVSPARIEVVGEVSELRAVIRVRKKRGGEEDGPRLFE